MVTLYDTTLRDGTQREGMSLSVEDKLRIAAKLDLLGVHYIEGGFPGSNPKDIEFFERARDLKLEQRGHHRVRHRRCAQGHARRGRPGPLRRCSNRLPGALHLRQGVGHARHRDAAAPRSRRTCGWSATRSPTSRRRAARSSSTPSTSSTATRPNPTYALEVVPAAAEAGADAVVLCDTNGGHAAPRGRARSCGEVAAR